MNAMIRARFPARALLLLRRRAEGDMLISVKAPSSYRMLCHEAAKRACLDISFVEPRCCIFSNEYGDRVRLGPVVKRAGESLTDEIKSIDQQISDGTIIYLLQIIG